MLLPFGMSLAEEDGWSPAKQVLKLGPARRNWLWLLSAGLHSELCSCGSQLQHEGNPGHNISHGPMESCSLIIFRDVGPAEVLPSLPRGRKHPKP